MLLRLRLGNAPHIAALLLLLGIVLGGAVDAAACEPASEMVTVTTITADAEISANPGTRDQIPSQERHGDCIHGHCHHGAQQVPSIAFQVESPIAAVEHVAAGESDLAPSPPGSLKRPPRA